MVARVAFVFELLGTKTGATVWAHKYVHDEAVNKINVSALVEAIDRNVHRGLDEVIESLERYLSSVKTTAAPVATLAEVFVEKSLPLACVEMPGKFLRSMFAVAGISLHGFEHFGISAVLMV